MLRNIVSFIRKLWYFCCGHLLTIFRYDRKYLASRWFSGKMHGFFSVGWQWVVTDAIMCSLMQVNRGVPWPVSARTTVIGHKNIEFHPDDLNNFQSFGCYYQGIGRIVMGQGTYIAPNVGIITSNHDPTDLNRHVEPKPVLLGERCWIGMNSVILPGVILGDNTIVGAASIVTHSFPEGHCVLAGNPAKVIKIVPHKKG